MGWLDSVVSAGSDLLKSNSGKIISGVAGAVLGSGDKKTSGQSGSNASSGSTITQMPAWMNDAARQLMTQQTNLSSQGYQQYQAPQVAGLTPDQQAAANLVRTNTGQAGAVISDAMGNYDPNAGSGMLTRASTYLNGAGGSYTDPGVADKFMNPYNQNVIDKSKSEALRTWTDQILPGMEAQFVRNGNYGSSAHAREMGKNATNLTSRLQENAGAMLADSYQAGAGQFNTENNQRGQLAQIASGLGTTEANMEGTALNNQLRAADAWSGSQADDVAALQGIGGQQQELDQRQLDVAKRDWDAANGYAQNQINTTTGLLGQLSGNVDKSTSTQNTSNNSQANTKHIDPITGAIQGVEAGSQLEELLAGLKKPAPAGSSPKIDPRTNTGVVDPNSQAGGVTGSVFRRGGRVAPHGMLHRLAESDRRASMRAR